jgi:hypothetical protein
MKKAKWIELGVVGVDSGQLMICDPSYIDSQWEKENLEENELTAIHPNGKKEKVKRCSKKWFKIIDDVNKGKIKLEGDDFKKPKHNFSYPACVEQTLKNSYGQLNFKMGYEGAGVVFESGFGDGVYQVFGKIEKIKDWGERITEVRIKLI